MLLFKNDLLLTVSFIYLLCGILFLTIFLIIINKIFKNIKILKLALNLIIFILIYVFLLHNNNFCLNYYFFNYLYFSSEISYNFLNILLLCSLIFFISFFAILKKNFFINVEYFLITLLIIFGIINLLLSNDLLSMYMSLELMSLGLYILASYYKYINYSVEAGLKYFILGALASGILLFGISVIYGLTGLTNFLDLRHIIYFNNFHFNLELNLNYKIWLFENFNIIFNLGLTLILISVLFKLAIVPFHFWIPDVYKGSPLISVYFFSIIPKIGILGLFINFFILNLLYFSNIQIQNKICFFIIISWFVGSFLALYQTNLKRLLAYSSIVHMGFILLGLILYNISGVFFYNIIYILLLINIFLTFLNLSRKTHIETIYELTNLFKLNPYLSFNLAILLFSFAGIPPLMGFFGKFYILTFSLNLGYYYITFIGLIFSVVSSFYYLRIVKLIFSEYKTIYINYKPLSNSLNLSFISLTLFFNLSFFLNPNFLLIFVQLLIY